VCPEWWDVPSVNPRTDRPIKIEGPTFRDLEDECGPPDWMPAFMINDRRWHYPRRQLRSLWPYHQYDRAVAGGSIASGNRPKRYPWYDLVPAKLDKGASSSKVRPISTRNRFANFPRGSSSEGRRELVPITFDKGTMPLQTRDPIRDPPRYPWYDLVPIEISRSGPLELKRNLEALSVDKSAPPLHGRDPIREPSRYPWYKLVPIRAAGILICTPI
jgi:hypothetical protein